MGDEPSVRWGQRAPVRWIGARCVTPCCLVPEASVEIVAASGSFGLLRLIQHKVRERTIWIDSVTSMPVNPVLKPKSASNNHVAVVEHSFIDDSLQ